MILTILVKRNKLLDDYLKSLIDNARGSLVRPVFKRIGYKYYTAGNGLVLLVLAIEFSLPNVIPRVFQYYVMRLKLKKIGYYKEGGHSKLVSYKQAVNYLAMINGGDV